MLFLQYYTPPCRPTVCLSLPVCPLSVYLPVSTSICMSFPPCLSSIYLSSSASMSLSVCPFPAVSLLSLPGCFYRTVSICLSLPVPIFCLSSVFTLISPSFLVSFHMSLFCLQLSVFLCLFVFIFLSVFVPSYGICVSSVPTCLFLPACLSLNVFLFILLFLSLPSCLCLPFSN